MSLTTTKAAAKEKITECIVTKKPVKYLEYVTEQNAYLYKDQQTLK